jgi:hypothetical protein
LEKTLALMIIAFCVGDAVAHGGGLDELGGHNEKKAGTYHLHRGPLSGRDFDSKSDAKDALNSLTKTPYPNMVTGNVWRGLTVAPEKRCAPYERRPYRYSSSVEYAVVDRLGSIYSPYTGEVFSSVKQADIEHIVALLSEAHDSGMCAFPDAVKRRFANDLNNLTLASPRVNRWEKAGKDAGEWFPPVNRCWFANRVILVKKKYGLTVDGKEAKALDTVLDSCETDSRR